jgi:transcriptional regulator with XRE-family HTH domain
MFEILALRKKLNLTQSELADFLIMSRPLLALVEQNRRKMLGWPLLNLLKIKELVYNKENEANANFYSNTAELQNAKAELEKRNQQIIGLMRSKKDELMQMQKAYETEIKPLAYWQYMQKNPVGLSPIQYEWVKERQSLQQQQLENVGLLAQHKLKIRLTELSNELLMNKKFLKMKG